MSGEKEEGGQRLARGISLRERERELGLKVTHSERKRRM